MPFVKFKKIPETSLGICLDIAISRKLLYTRYPIVAPSASREQRYLAYKGNFGYFREILATSEKLLLALTRNAHCTLDSKDQYLKIIFWPVSWFILAGNSIPRFTVSVDKIIFAF